MNTIFETGHSKNVANFEEVISICTGYGAAYNPSKASIKIPAMTTLLTTARNVLQAAKAAKTTYDNATNARELTFSNLKKLSTRIINALEATDATQQLIDDALTINHKIHGVRAKKLVEKPVDETATAVAPEDEHKNISVSQQSYDSLVDHFAKLIQVVSSEPLYAPNEADLKVTALNAQLTSLKAANTSVINAHTAYTNTNIGRNSVLYQPVVGLFDIANEVKKYVKSVFGAISPQFKQISKIKFRKNGY
ncbi:MAG: hypothetical protein PHD97_12755 [Bacteroidales bacterium]|nr:hypothetical protein [Bacteroidales bacterium]